MTNAYLRIITFIFLVVQRNLKFMRRVSYHLTYRANRGVFLIFYIVLKYEPCVVGPCHHGMARPQVADRGTASNMEGSCE